MKPWEELGLSRSTYFAHRRAGTLDAAVARRARRMAAAAPPDTPPHPAPVVEEQSVLLTGVRRYMDLALQLSIRALEDAAEKQQVIPIKLALQLSNPLVRLAAAQLEADSQRAPQAIGADYEVSADE